jgi:electron transport complex protein RnfG
MRDIVVPVFVITVVCLLSSLALALVNNLTEGRIAEQRRLNQRKAVEVALLNSDVRCDQDPSGNVIEIPEWKDEEGQPKKICLGLDNGQIIGIAFTSEGEGYNGFISIMMGVDLEGELLGIEILEHLETPGLGAKIDTPLFKQQFMGKSREGSPTGKLEVVKGGPADENWEIEALTGATVSPRGVVQAVNDGLDMFQKYKDQILSRAKSSGVAK